MFSNARRTWVLLDIGSAHKYLENMSWTMRTLVNVASARGLLPSGRPSDLTQYCRRMMAVVGGLGVLLTRR